MKTTFHYLKITTCILMIILTISQLNLQAQESEYKDAPYFPGMPNYVIDYAEDIEFDNYHFFDGTKCPIVEGKKSLRIYVIKEGVTQASELQIVRNYANAVKSMGGTVFVAGVFQSEDAECAENSGSQMMAGKFVKDGNEVWIEVFPGNGGENYRFTEVIKGIMKQDVNASGISEAVKRDKRKTLPGDQTIEGNKTPVGIATVQTPENQTDFATKADLDALKAEVDAIKRQLQIIDVAPDEPVTDVEGNTYKTIRIGTQVWMGENLKTTKFNNGREISAVPSTKGEFLWNGLTTPAYCWYNDFSGYRNTSYGALYNWFTVKTGYLCPTGWHVPNDSEWTTLITYLGGEGVAGGKLKETGTLHWNNPNVGATNQSGFTALPGGRRRVNANPPVFTDLREMAVWWSSSEFNASLALNFGLSYQDGVAEKDQAQKQSGFSVRCIKDN